DAARLTDDSATTNEVATALDGADLAHIAAHGSFRTDNPLFSSVRLSDGPLTVYDLERLSRAPRRVVLSACNTGLALARPGDELMGLSSLPEPGHRDAGGQRRPDARHDRPRAARRLSSSPGKGRE